MRHGTTVLVSNIPRKGKSLLDWHETAVEAFEENANDHDSLYARSTTLPSDYN